GPVPAFRERRSTPGAVEGDPRGCAGRRGGAGHRADEDSLRPRWRRNGQDSPGRAVPPLSERPRMPGAPDGHAKRPCEARHPAEDGARAPEGRGGGWPREAVTPPRPPRVTERPAGVVV